MHRPIVGRAASPHPKCGVDRKWRWRDHLAMRSEPTPSGLPQRLNAPAQLQAWIDLRDRLQRLHAELEYLQLMLKMRLPR
jgi:hypothetical protein